MLGTGFLKKTTLVLMNLDADRVKDQHEAMAYIVSIPPAAGGAAGGGVILWVIGFLTHTGPL